MKALSVQQPWAWAIIHAGKCIENRDWRTHHRGWIAIHASATVRKGERMPRGVRAPREEELIPGAIIGVVRIVDVVEWSRSKWFDPRSKFGWVLERPRAFRKPIACSGALSLWDVPSAVAAQITRQLGRLPEKARAA
jgi:hypothetical protein